MTSKWTVYEPTISEYGGGHYEFQLPPGSMFDLPNGQGVAEEGTRGTGPTKYCLEHKFVQTGTKRSWCSKCDRDAVWDNAACRFVLPRELLDRHQSL